MNPSVSSRQERSRQSLRYRLADQQQTSRRQRVESDVQERHRLRERNKDSTAEFLLERTMVVRERVNPLCTEGIVLASSHCADEVRESLLLVVQRRKSPTRNGDHRPYFHDTRVSLYSESAAVSFSARSSLFSCIKGRVLALYGLPVHCLTSTPVQDSNVDLRLPRCRALSRRPPRPAKGRPPILRKLVPV